MLSPSRRKHAHAEYRESMPPVTRRGIGDLGSGFDIPHHNAGIA
jgi:hypothetical protein